MPHDLPSCAGPCTADIFRRYSPYVAAIAFRLLGSDGEIDDVVQDVFMAAFEGLPRLREPAAVKGWLATVTVRKVRRRLRVRRTMAFFGFDDVPSRDEPVAPRADAEQQVLLRQVYRVLAEIPVEQRLAWALRHMQGERLEDVARLTGCSLATAKRRIAAAQETIEATLADRVSSSCGTEQALWAA